MLKRPLNLYGICLLHLVGLFMFSKGFFPHKKATLSGYAIPSEDAPPAIFNKLVFVLIDALRSDLAFGSTSYMSQVKDFIDQGIAIPFTAKASTPTVTLPRLKCLTTGAIPGFLDAIFNIAESDSSSTVALQDSWLQQMLIAKKRIHMYGDDTWLRLFPGSFAASEGTSSFFVSDFTEVDNNVTRHLDHELISPNWETLILHYLGLDHIGHLDGPNSKHMPAKQMEMDSIISRIYSSTSRSDDATGSRTLQIVVGDHGMTNDGNHGGASDPETHTALILISKLFQSDESLETDTPGKASAHSVSEDSNLLSYHSKVLQSDLVPILCMALGLPIPQNSVGIIPRATLRIWSDPVDQFKALALNARQLQKLINAGSCESVRYHTRLLCLVSDPSSSNTCALQDIDFSTGTDAPQELVAEYYSLMQAMQETLMSASNDFDTRSMYVGIVILFVSLIASVGWHLEDVPKAPLDLIVWAVPILYSCTAFASSFVEEEQVFWYYIASFLLVLLALRSIDKQASRVATLSVISPLLLFRIIRRYNQTGQKYAGAPDIYHFIQTLNPYWTANALAACYAGFVATYIRSWRSISMLRLVTALSVGYFKNLTDVDASGKLLWSARVSWALLFINVVTTTLTKEPKRKNEALMFCVSMLFALQSRLQNLPLLFLFSGINRILQQQTRAPEWTITTFVVLQQASFFALGNTNSLSGLDLSQAYNGVSRYNEGVVGSLLFVSSFIGPIYWHTALLNYTRNNETRKRFARQFMCVTTCMYTTAICISCESLKHHLFVFSVFSPKLLFSAAWSVFYSLAILSI